MIRVAVFASLVVVFSLLLRTSHAASAYPCHDDKSGMGKGVTCTVVKLPRGLCTSCPLRPPNSRGQFIECADTYDTSASSCLPAMKQYVASNPCDPIRADAVVKLEANPADDAARQVVDYFLYSVCEQCCDCVPMGANKDFFDDYNKAHSSSNPALYDAARGNCPAHAYYDICKVLPKVKGFTHGSAGNLESRPPACKLLNEWFVSDASKDWQDEPNSAISSDLRIFLNNLLQVGECAKKSLWEQCYDLESKQKHLGVPEVIPDVPTSDEEPEPPKEDNKAPAPAPVTKPTPPENGKSEEPTTAAPTTSEPISTNPAPTSPSNANPTDSTPSKETPSVPASTGKDEAPAPSDGETSKAPNSADSEATSNAPSGTPTNAPIGTIPSSNPTPAESDTGATGELAESSIEPGKVRECFPGDAILRLASGEHITMDKLSIGDKVLVDGEGRYEAVYMMSHADSQARRMHIRIDLEDGRHVVMTYGHILQVNGRLSFARDVKAGNMVMTNTGQGMVRRTSSTVKVGLYNPHTASGTIVVNDVICSTFTDAVQDSMATALLSPLRAIFRLGGGTLIRSGTTAIL